LAKITGLSRTQVMRLIQPWNSRKKLMIERAARRQFARRYSAEDIVLLAAVDVRARGPVGAGGATDSASGNTR